MSKYNFYAEPKDSDCFIIVTGSENLNILKFILLNTGLNKYYSVVNEPLKKDCLVQEYHCYKLLTLGWTHNGKEHWYDEDKSSFSVVIIPNYLIMCIKDFYNKPFKKDDFVNKLKEDTDFKYYIEEIFGRDIDYVDMYFDRNDNWTLTKLEVKEIRTITYKNSNE